MKELIQSLYKDNNEKIEKRINDLIRQYKQEDEKRQLDQNDVMMITYGDSIIQKDQLSLETLRHFLDENVKDSISAVHLLPMFPYSSDDGFSVIDYLKINPDLGDWEQVNKLSEKYDLMFDAVINHISKESDWFKGYKEGKEKFKDFFIECDKSVDYSQVVRPRSLPLYYDYETVDGVKTLWATFSEDQLDINYENPEVLFEILKVLLEYCKNGAMYIRFDAIGFAWKKVGTTCIHLQETHDLVKLMRYVVRECYPNVRVITETNVPHKENISYFGNGFDEAHLVYQFPLPPLTMYSFLVGDATKLSKWADSLKETRLTDETTYFNFLASHDGIGMRPTEGILTEEEKEIMVQNTLQKGGRIGYKNNPDGSKSPYELNINYLSALTDNTMTVETMTQKFLASQMVLLSLQGVPGIYVHSLLGSENDIQGMTSSNINRRINREKLKYHQLVNELKNPDSVRSSIFKKYLELLQLRKEHNAFSPSSGQDVLDIDKRVFSIIRESKDEKILVLINVSNEVVQLETAFSGKDLISNVTVDKKIELKPYQYMWIKLEG